MRNAMRATTMIKHPLLSGLLAFALTAVGTVGLLAAFGTVCVARGLPWTWVPPGLSKKMAGRPL